MLDTVLQIGRAFRSSVTGLKHHRYVKSCPQEQPPCLISFNRTKVGLKSCIYNGNKLHPKSFNRILKGFWYGKCDN